LVRFFYFHRSMISRSVILHIPSWFPTDEDPFAGDFIQRHMQAIQGIQPILSVQFTKSNTVSNIQIMLNAEAEVPYIEVLIPKKTTLPFLQKWIAQRQQTKSIKALVAFLRLKDIKVLAIHSHVLHPAANIARTLKKRLNCPWVHTEHWSALTKENGEFERKSGVFRRFYKSITKEVNAFTFVSNYLQKSFNTHFSSEAPQYIISNSVNTSLFHLKPKQSKEKPFRFLHVSSLGEAKQAEAIIEAFERINDKDAELWIVGGSEKKNFELRKKHPKETLQFLPSQAYEDIALLMQDADVLVLNSLYETQSCVAIEALCCGVPVIAPAVAALPEFLNPSNSILFAEGDIESALNNAFEIIPQLDPENISKAATQKYSYTNIEKEFKRVYSELDLI